MKSTANIQFRPRSMPVQWVDAPVVGPLRIGRRRRIDRPVWTPRCGIRTLQRGFPTLPMRSLRAFTLLELMVVIAIVGFIAALTLPHVRGFGQANSMTAATRQLLDDVALARQRAMVNRSTVYMVFVPPQFWLYTVNANGAALAYDNGVAANRQETNLLTHQCGAYALISLGSVGDQPGRHYPRYITDWRFLPDGVFIAPFEFNLASNATPYTNIYTTNTLSGIIITNQVRGWSTASVPFPSLSVSANPQTAQPTAAYMTLPCIAFSPQGGLTTQFTNQYIVLARGGIFYPTDTNGAPLFQPPLISETPPNNDVNNPNLIQIDWMTARATLIQNQLQ